MYFAKFRKFIGLGIVAASWLLAGCSANVFKDQITAFDSAVGATAATVSTYEQKDVSTGQAADFSQVILEKRRLHLDKSACQPDAKPDNCVLSAETASGNKDFQPLTPSASIKEPQDLANLLKTYSGDLAKVVSASTESDLDKAVGNLGTSLDGLAKATGLGSSTFAADIDPITAVFKFIGDNYVEYKRVQILKKATEMADPLVQEAAKKLAGVVTDSKNSIIKFRQSEIALRIDYYNYVVEGSPNSGPVYADGKLIENIVLPDIVSDVNALHDLIASNPGDAISKMATAHSALRAALASPTAGFDTSVSALTAFGQQVKAAYDAINKIK